MMASKHQNILQPKRLNSAEVGRVQNPKGVQRPDGPTLTLNGVTIGLSPTVHHVGVGGLGLGPFSNNSSMSNSNQNNTTPAKKGSTTMAKRNARERNRVKQVNQGFQTLRQHIPDSYRMKKMSKVDTLRCALDYIRSMEQLLEISPKLFPSREPIYHGFTGGDMNQHLDKICSMEETYGESMSLDQSFSSFSENEESPSHDMNNDPDQGSGCLNSSSENHFPVSLQQQHQLHPHHHHQDQLNSESIEIVTSSEGNNGSFESLVGSSPSSHTTPNSTSSTPSILLPAQLHSHSNNINMKIENSIEMIPSDENYNPPSNGPFIRVVEIIQLQQ